MVEARILPGTQSCVCQNHCQSKQVFRQFYQNHNLYLTKFCLFSCRSPLKHCCHEEFFWPCIPGEQAEIPDLPFRDILASVVRLALHFLFHLSLLCNFCPFLSLGKSSIDLCDNLVQYRTSLGKISSLPLWRVKKSSQCALASVFPSLPWPCLTPFLSTRTQSFALFRRVQLDFGFSKGVCQGHKLKVQMCFGLGLPSPSMPWSATSPLFVFVNPVFCNSGPTMPL